MQGLRKRLWRGSGSVQQIVGRRNLAALTRLAVERMDDDQARETCMFDLDNTRSPIQPSDRMEMFWQLRQSGHRTHAEAGYAHMAFFNFRYA